MATIQRERSLTQILKEVEQASRFELYAYYCGASRDGCSSRSHRTFRITQKDRDWLEVLHRVIARQDRKGWIYREGRRSVWTIETGLRPDPVPVPLDHPAQLAAFARGYFDAEGGIPQSADSRFYIQLVQKDRRDLGLLRMYLESLSISCGKLHNPSVRVDPDYWRFFIKAQSHQRFISMIGSWHPRKRSLLDERRLRGTANLRSRIG